MGALAQPQTVSPNRGKIRQSPSASSLENWGVSSGGTVLWGSGAFQLLRTLAVADGWDRGGLGRRVKGLSGRADERDAIGGRRHLELRHGLAKSLRLHPGLYRVSWFLSRGTPSLTRDSISAVVIGRPAWRCFGYFVRATLFDRCVIVLAMVWRASIAGHVSGRRLHLIGGLRNPFAWPPSAALLRKTLRFVSGRAPPVP